ncbi:cytochrome P450 [Streptomyces sp. A1547]|uniref:cytochrome P450 n=1 Tax=Streptomyces sp. A1547 TaxID=2563105 RepID=UPI00109E79AA|nr:cytochrome P450 [Streptomyces sp. A1547]THA40899.1 cytochrome P450 [Streptomyces sp. A1547]
MSDAISFEEHWDRTHQFDPPAIFDSLRAERPLARMVYPDGHVGWIATSHELVRKVLSDPRFSHNLENFHFPVTRFGEPAVGSSPEIPGMFIHMDPPNHTRYRRLLTAEFTARRASRLTSRVEAVAAEQIAVMREHGGPVDLVANFAEPLVLRVLSEMVGLPYEERDRYAHAPAVLHDPDSTQEEVGAAFAQLTPFIVEVVEGKRKEPGDDLISRLVADGELTTEEVCNIVTLLLFAGYETTENALAVGVFALLHHADQMAALRADPSKLDAAIEELLRYISINQYEMYRTALEDIELDGHLVKKGDTVTVSLPAANRDPAKFECPAQLDIDRDTSGHVAFGFGIHQCLGQNLARVELRAGLSALLQAFPDLRLAVAVDEVPLRLKGSVFAVKSLPVSW